MPKVKLEGFEGDPDAEANGPPAALTGTGFGSGVSRLVFGLLFALTGAIGSAAGMQYGWFEDANYGIAGIVVASVLAGLFVLAWLNFHAARVVGTRDVTVRRAIGAAALQVVFVPAAFLAIDWLMGKVAVPAQAVPYAPYAPYLGGAMAFALAAKLGFRANIFRATAATLVAYVLPVAATFGTVYARPNVPAAAEDTAVYYADRAVAWLNAHNLHYALEQYRKDNAGLMPASIGDLQAKFAAPAATNSERSPSLTTLWPPQRVRDGFVLATGWQTTPGAPVPAVTEPEKLVLAYSDVRRSPLPQCHACLLNAAVSNAPASQPAGPDASESVVLFANGQVRFLKEDELTVALGDTSKKLAAATVRQAVPEVEVPATRRPPVQKPAPGSNDEMPTGELFGGKGRS